MSAIHLFDTLKQLNGFKSDYQLARHLGVHAPAISRQRIAAANGGAYQGVNYRINGDMILAIYDQDGMSIEDIRRLVAL